MQGKIVKVSGPLIVAENMADSKMYEHQAARMRKNFLYRFFGQIPSNALRPRIPHRRKVCQP